MQQMTGGSNTINLGISRFTPGFVMTIVQTAHDSQGIYRGQKSMGTFQVGSNIKPGGKGPVYTGSRTRTK